jgi:hypothetical protein
MSTVESNSRRDTSSCPALIAASLTMHPFGRILVPLVTCFRQLAERSFDVVPPPLVLQPTPNQLSDKRAAASWADSRIELGNEVVVQRNVQTHVLMLAHSGTREDVVCRLTGPPRPAIHYVGTSAWSATPC